jgi:uncharacterized NAD(P)/FAD-binding protein YdhS
VNLLPRTIVIVGAGFSGTAVAINLLRLSYWKPVRVVLLERAERMGRGAAYAERSHPYLLNVPAGRMSLNSSDPLEFLKFAQTRVPNATADDFLPRSLYGDYVEAALAEAELRSPPHVHLHRIHGDVCSVERVGNNTPFRLELRDGSSFVADDVVLAMGNPPPAHFPGTEPLLGTPQYIPDPWRSSPKFHPGETVLIIGTGLTMADTVLAGTEPTPGASKALARHPAATSDTTFHEPAPTTPTHGASAEDGDSRSLAAPGHVTIHAISRRGLVPPSQTAFRHAGCDDNGVALLRAASLSARRLVRAVRELTEEVERRGGDWREAITCVRNFAPAIWQRLSTRERQRFLRHARPYWDVHRHRLPQDTLAKLHDLRRADKLHVHAGRILKFERIDEKVHVTWRPRGTDDVQTLVVDRVINCTGADYSPNRSRDPLMRSLLAQGLATSDALGLGLRTSNHGALLDSHNRVASNLYYIGPMLRADHWECTAAQELRVHAERLAHHLAAPAIKPVFSATRRAPKTAPRDPAHPGDLTPTLTSALPSTTAPTI